MYVRMVFSYSSRFAPSIIENQTTLPLFSLLRTLFIRKFHSYSGDYRHLHIRSINEKELRNASGHVLCAGVGLLGSRFGWFALPQSGVSIFRPISV